MSSTPSTIEGQLSLGEPSRLKFYAINTAIFGMNYFSSVLIVALNKLLFSAYSYTYPSFLSFIHQVVVSIGLFIAVKVKLVEAKKIPWRDAFILAGFFAPSIPLANVSLMVNSIGFYQITKALIVPFIVLVQVVYYRKHFPLKILLTLGVIVIGATIAQVTDVEINPLGTFIALVNVVWVGLAQIWAETYQKRLESVSPIQLLIYIMPLSSLMLLPLALLLEGFNPVTSFFVCGASCQIVIALTGILSFGVNLSVFLILRRMSAVVLQVFGHAKTFSIMLLPVLFFGQVFVVNNVMGVVLCLGASVYYTYLKITSPKEEPVAAVNHDESKRDDKNEEEKEEEELVPLTTSEK